MDKIDVYDFDKTLYKRDSSVQFFLFCLRRKKSIVKYIPGILILYVFSIFKLINKIKLKEYYFKFLKDFDNISELVNKFWEKNKEYINTDIINNNKNQKIVISASPLFLIEKVCFDIGIDKVIATDVNKSNGRFISNNCHDIEKLNRLNKQYKKYTIENFYSDSYSDECLAKISKNAFYIRDGEIEIWNFNKVSRIFNKLIELIFKLVLSFIVFACFFLSYRNYACRNIPKYNNFICLIFGILFLLVIYLLNKFIFKKIKFSDKKIKIFVVIISIFMTFFLYYLAKKYWFLTGWDASFVRENANFIASNRLDIIDNSYFSKFQNNIFITILYSFLIRFSNFVGVKDYNSTLLFSNCMLFSLTSILIFLTMMRLTKNNKRISFFGYLVYYLLIGLSPWVVVPYSDTISLFMILLIYYLFLISEDAKKYKIIYFALIILISIIGYKVKPQILVLTISILLYKFSKFDFIKLKNIKTYIYITIGIFGYLIFSMIYNNLEQKYFNINKEMNFGAANYLMWGHNYETRGVFPISDYKFSESFNTNKERNRANIDKFIERVKYLKFGGLIELYIDKTLTNFNDGTFAWGREGEFYNKIYDGGSQMLKNFYYTTGNNNWIFKIYCQSIWVVILCFNLLLAFKKCNYKILILKLSIIGIFMFELLFEARARYIFAFCPLFIILMSYYIFRKERIINDDVI